MRILFFVLLFTISVINGYSQRQSFIVERVDDIRRDIIYENVDNPLNVLVENYPCDSITLTTDNGIIKRDSCNYWVDPIWAGSVEITITADSMGYKKTIGEAQFYAIQLPYPLFKIGPSSGGKISKKLFAAQEYVRAEYENIPIDLHAHLDSFTVTVIRHKKIIFTKRNYTNKLDESIRSEFNLLQQNDIVQFSDIWSWLPDQTEKKLEDATMTMVEYPAYKD